MSELRIEICPETGICSIVKGSTNKLDLMPGEVIELRKTGSNPDGMRKALSEYDPTLAASLDSDEMQQVVNVLS